MIALIGLMGSGKSTVGRQLAKRLGRPCVDLDAEIVAKAGKSIPEIFRDDGECTFRALESEVLQYCCDTRGKCILATGGGVVMSEANRQRLEQASLVVWLDAPSEVLAKRIAGDENRPLLDGVDVLRKAQELDRQRRPYYSQCADLQLDTSSLSAYAIVNEICAWVARQKGRYG